MPPRVLILAPVALILLFSGCSQPAEDAAPSIPPTELAAVRTPPPQYPFELFCKGVHGTVTLGVTIGPGIHPTEINVLTSSGNAQLDELAVNTVKDWDFKPATSNGQPVARKIEIPMNFPAASGERPAECFQFDTPN